MANEAIKRYTESVSGDVIQDYTCSGAVGIEKGTLLKLTDPRTAVLADGTQDVLCGIAAREIVANSGKTQIAVHKKGYFDMKASGAILLGYPVTSVAGYPNYVKQATGTASGATILGYCEETAADSEVVLIRVDL